MAAKIRYIACVSQQPDAVAAFYRDKLGFAEIARAPEGDVSLGDGALKLAIFKGREDLGEVRLQPGLHHVGFQVDDIEAIKARYRRANPRGMVVPESGRHRGEVRLYDPECHPVSLSVSAFGLSGQTPQRLRRLAFGTLDPDAMAEFYEQVFGLRRVAVSGAPSSGPPSATTRPSQAVSDGEVTLEFHDYFATGGAVAGARYGLARCGFALGAASPQGELADPDGNLIVLDRS